ncbi:hypothetical protein [Formosa haliotis]|uniref:hypothetical protein n=1 Tax=Formosa haliotis TaxID=1555194 RepID=UPI000825D342|nr:hypothetical protein [Formosa haliotis]
MKHYLILILLFSIGYSTVLYSQEDADILYAELTLKPSYQVPQFYTWTQLKFIENEVGFFQIWLETIQFWHSDATRKERWLERSEDYFKDEYVSKFEQEFKVPVKLNTFIMQAKMNAISNKIVDELTTDLFVLGFIWMLLGIAVVLTKGEFLIFDLIFTLIISVWIGVKTHNIKTELKSYVEIEKLDTSRRMTNMIKLDNKVETYFLP